ncbi:cytochrome c-type biogenesis protein [Salinisphaera orenii]|uniref:cytochrome c-type biogenesis protein n=1 Tax=Salinisphaera orenii TaxID=856731 RepID=UPI000DBE2176
MRWLVLAVLMFSSLMVTAADLSDAQRARYHELTAELRCLICKNRSIAESNAPLAKDLRQIVARKIAAGRSNARIEQFLVDRYGEWVLYDPPFEYKTWLLWLTPFGLVLIGLGIFVLLNRTTTPPSTELSADQRRRLARIRAEHDDSPQNAEDHR